MESAAEVEAALEPLRQTLRPDGADLTVSAFEGDAVTVELQLGPDACHECIVGTEVLEGVIAHQLKSAGLPVNSVVLQDPRA